jgi:hypothetical protein
VSDRDIDQELADYAAQWRRAQSPLAAEVRRGPAATRRVRPQLLVAAIAVVVLVAGGIAFVANRESNTAPRIESPTGVVPSSVAPTTSGANAVPKLDVVPLYFPISASDRYTAVDLGAVLALPIGANGIPTQDQQEALKACQILAGRPGVAPFPAHFFDFEDPAYYRGTPSAPTYNAPAPPSTPPTCTPKAAKAKATIAELGTFYQWIQAMYDLERDPTIAAAKAQQIECLHDRGIDSVDPDGFITDGWNQRHPDQTAQAHLDFADCIGPTVAAREQVRTAYRNEFLATHRADVERLQRAFDDYLDAMYNPSTPSGPVGNRPDMTFDDGCITVTRGPSDTLEPSDTQQASSATGVDAKELSVVPGKVGVCDKSPIPRTAIVVVHRTGAGSDAGGMLYVMDRATGKLVDQRQMTP